MRLHQLEIQAFGPYPGQVEVDFDHLSSAGLFLLAGPTGAGKTSVLDAICFALYGDVPGVRGAAKRLRCDTAAAEVAPRVRLEVTLAGRRFRFTRSPAWERPKRRGSGMTTEQARVLCEERIDGAWEALSTRLDETGHLVGGLIGMTMSQFCQVALLPQGDFQSFLRARSEERHQLLQQLFATGRFEQLERWVREAARDAGREAQRLADEVGHCISRIDESVQELTEVPQCPLTSSDLPQADGSGAIEAWSASLAHAAADHAQQTSQRLRGVRMRHEAAQRRVADARQRASLRARGLAAEEELAALDAGRPARERDRRRVAAAEEAAALLPLHRLLRQQEAAASRARQRRIEGQQALTVGLRVFGDVPPAGAEHELIELRRRVDAALQQVGAVLPLGARRDETAAQLEELSDQIHETTLRQRAVQDRLEALPERLSRAREQAARARDAAASLPALAERVTALSELRGSIIRLQSREPLLIEAQTAVLTARERVQAVREEWLDLREARINGMAAELASGLAAGCECPVCGSAEHPAPARRAGAGVTAADEKAARDRLTDLEFALTSAEEEERGLAEEVAALRALIAGRELASVDVELDALTTAHDEAARAATALPDLEEALGELSRQHEEDRQVATALGERLAELRSSHTACQDELRRTRDRIEEVLADYPGDDLGRVHGELTKVRDLVLETLDAHAAVVACEEALAATDEQFGARMAESPFDGVEQLLAAALPAAELAALVDRIDAEERRELIARSTLADDEVRAALDADADDPRLAEEAAAAAQHELEVAQGEAARAVRLTQRLEELRRSLTERVAAWRPAHDAHVTAADLAAFLEGKSADNPLRMRLSGYVLAWRLSQVVDAANERLAGMTDSRYTLVHTDRRASRDTRGGLSLAVRDDWSGEERDPATLSGGETFLVSLALALGLADVVTAEAGGTSLDTLFVDEGFGSLDSETLDDVLDTLDELREGGRVVGVVSHVAEMRARIPVQLLVTKAPDGSRLRISSGPDRPHAS